MISYAQGDTSMLTTIIVCTLALALFAGLTLLRVLHFNKSANADMIVQAYAAFSYAGKSHEKAKHSPPKNKSDHLPPSSHFRMV